MSADSLCCICEHATTFYKYHVDCELYRDWQFRRQNCIYFAEKDKEEWLWMITKCASIVFGVMSIAKLITSANTSAALSAAATFAPTLCRTLKSRCHDSRWNVVVSIPRPGGNRLGRKEPWKCLVFALNSRRNWTGGLIAASSTASTMPRQLWTMPLKSGVCIMRQSLRMVCFWIVIGFRPASPLRFAAPRRIFAKSVTNFTEISEIIKFAPWNITSKFWLVMAAGLLMQSATITKVQFQSVTCWKQCTISQPIKRELSHEKPCL